MEKIIEIDYKLDVVPIPGVQKEYDVDALILSNWEEIIVDKRMHDDERYRSRLRFSLAHELGHLILHRKEWSQLDVGELADHEKLMERMDAQSYDNMEVQASIFANNLLVPREDLSRLKKKTIEEKEINPDDFDKEMLNKYLAKPLSKKFKVSEEAMEIALNHVS